VLIRNHLNFRITASKCIEKFRNLQAFSLNEVQNSYVYSFDEVSKTSIVLQFDIWNTWAQFLEKQLLEIESNAGIDSAMAKTIVRTAKEKYGTYIEILNNSPEHFPQEFSELHIKSNGTVADRFMEKISKVEGKSTIDAIVYLIKTLEGFLQSCLFELQEVDYLVFKCKIENKQPPFLSIDSRDLRDANSNTPCSTVRRAKIYQKAFNLKSIVVKSYVEGTSNIDGILNNIEGLGFDIAQVRY